MTNFLSHPFRAVDTFGLTQGYIAFHPGLFHLGPLGLYSEVHLISILAMSAPEHSS